MKEENGNSFIAKLKKRVISSSVSPERANFKPGQKSAISNPTTPSRQNIPRGEIKGMKNITAKPEKAKTSVRSRVNKASNVQGIPVVAKHLPEL